MSKKISLALFTRTRDGIGQSFPDIIENSDFLAVLDGELLIGRDRVVGSFNELQQCLK
ncbi:MAG: DNA ligase-1 [Cellvibrionaceae bacterium]